MDPALPIEEYLRLAAEPPAYDDAPTEEQRAMIANGGVLIPKADGDAGVPLGHDPDDIAGRQVVIDHHPDYPGQAYSFRVDGKNDPILREVFGRYAEQMRSPNKSERKAATEAAMVEVAALKADQSQHGRVASNGRPGAAGRQQTNPAFAEQRKRVPVEFDFGGVDGRRLAEYSDVVIHESCLVLVADAALRASGAYLPPALEPPRTVRVSVAGLAGPVTAYSTGLAFAHRDLYYCVLLIDRTA